MIRLYEFLKIILIIVLILELIEIFYFTINEKFMRLVYKALEKEEELNDEKIIKVAAVTAKLIIISGIIILVLYTVIEILKIKGM